MNPRLRLGSIFFTLSSDFFLHILKSYSDIVQYLLILKANILKASIFIASTLHLHHIILSEPKILLVDLHTFSILIHKILDDKLHHGKCLMSNGEN